MKHLPNISLNLCNCVTYISVLLPYFTNEESKNIIPVSPKCAPLTVTCQHLRIRLLAQQQKMSHLPTHRMLKQNPWEVDLLTSWSGRLSNPTCPERDRFRSSSFCNFKGEIFENSGTMPPGLPHVVRYYPLPPSFLDLHRKRRFLLYPHPPWLLRIWKN